MKTNHRTSISIFFFLLVYFFTQYPVQAQEPAWWTQQKAHCKLSPSLAYNDWVAEGSPCNAETAGSSNGPATGNSYYGLTAAQIAAQAAAAQLQATQMQLAGQVGTYVGTELGKLIFGDPAEDARKAALEQQQQAAAAQMQAQQEAIAAQQQREAAAEAERQRESAAAEAQRQREAKAQNLNQLGMSACKLGDYERGIKFFQDALDVMPGESEFQDNIRKAKDQEEAFNKSKQDGLSQLRGIADGGSFDNGLKDDGSTNLGLRRGDEEGTDDGLRPQGTSAFGLGGGSGSQTPPNTNTDPMVVELQGTSTAIIDPPPVNESGPQTQPPSSEAPILMGGSPPTVEELQKQAFIKQYGSNHVDQSNMVTTASNNDATDVKGNAHPYIDFGTSVSLYATSFAPNPVISYGSIPVLRLGSEELKAYLDGTNGDQKTILINAGEKSLFDIGKMEAECFGEGIGNIGKYIGIENGPELIWSGFKIDNGSDIMQQGYELWKK